MSLVKEIIKDLLPEDKKKKVVAVYGGGFKPPTKGHFNVVKQAISENPNIDEFIILVGGKDRDGITQSDSILIWDIYKQYLPIIVTVKTTSTPPIKAIYDYASNNPNEDVLFVIGAREGNEDDFADIAKRTKSLDNYPNLDLRTIITNGGVSGTAARNAAKISAEKLKPMLPSELSDDEVEEVYQLTSNNLSEIVLNCGCGQNPCITFGVTEGRKKKKDPKVGTGKKPKCSSRRLYTDEDPTDTVGVKFSSRQDIVDTLNKKSFKAKSHARQSQIINLIHQRVRAAYNRAKDPAVKKRLKTALNYAEKRKEMSKRKTQRLNKKKVNEKVGYGKSGYRYRAIYKKDGKYYYMQDNPFSPGIRQEFGPFKTKEAAKKKMGSFPPGTSYRDITEDELFEKLCKRGENYIAKRKREGEKHNPFLAGRAVKVCKGQIKGSDGKKKKDFRPKKGKTRSAQGRKPDIIKEIGIELSNYDGQILPGDVLRAPKGFPLGGKKLENSKELKVIKNSREGVNRYKLSLEDSDGKKYSVRNYEMDGEYKGKKLPQWGLIRKSKKNVDEGDTYEKMAAKGKKAGSLKQGTVRKRLKIPKGKKIPLSLINKEISRLKKMDKDPDKKGAQLGDKNQKYYKALQLAKTLKTTTNLQENASYSEDIDVKQRIKDLTLHMLNKGMNIQPLPKLVFKHNNVSNAKEFLGKTAYYDPNTMTIVLYTEGRHPKDIVRSYSHEMVHHIQNLEDRLGNIQTTNTQEDDHLDGLEQEANLIGTMTFRNWTDTLNEAIVGDKVVCDNCGWSWKITDGGNDVFICHKCGYDNTPIFEDKEPYKHKYGFNKKLGKDPFGLNAYARELAMGLEENEQPNYKIYVDMDGVVANFEKRFEDLSGMRSEPFVDKYGKEKFWNLIDEKYKVSFWRGIEPMDDAKKLIEFVSKHDYEMLTAPSRKNHSIIGKSLWIKDKIGKIFPSKPKVNYRQAKQKHLIKPQLTEYDILIDDREDTIDRWNKAGGTGILHTSADDTITQLKKLKL